MATEPTAVEAEQAHRDEMDDKGFYALHPFSASCEGIWDRDVIMWFSPEEFYEACQDV